MTNQEAIEILREKIFPCVTGDWKEAVGVAISALQAQDVPDINVGDMISRADTIDDLHGKDPSQIWDTADIEVWVNALPSAQPEDKCSECDAWNQYKNYPRRSRWIPCSERLPEKELWNDTFLVTVQCKHEDGYPDYVVCGAEYSSEYGWEYVPMPCGSIKVVAWIPVTIEPYQAERREE